MNRELVVNVNPTEISIALCEDKVLVELNKEQCQTGFAVGDIYFGKVRKIMPGLNAAFVNIGHEKDAFIHYLDLGSHFPSLRKMVASYQPGKRGMRVETMKLEEPIEKTGKIVDYLNVGDTIMVLWPIFRSPGATWCWCPSRRRCSCRRRSGRPRRRSA